MSLLFDTPTIDERLPSVASLAGEYGQAVTRCLPKEERDTAARRLALGMAIARLEKSLKKYGVQLTQDEATIAAFEIDRLVYEGTSK